jgi:hypothetical protein
MSYDNFVTNPLLRDKFIRRIIPQINFGGK